MIQAKGTKPFHVAQIFRELYSERLVGSLTAVVEKNIYLVRAHI